MKPLVRSEFLVLQALFTIWFRQAHVIESTFFCTTCAIMPNGGNEVTNKLEMKDLISSSK